MKTSRVAGVRGHGAVTAAPGNDTDILDVVGSVAAAQGLAIGYEFGLVPRLDSPGLFHEPLRVRGIEGMSIGDYLSSTNHKFSIRR